MSSYVGEIAALATAFCWSLTSTFFSIAGRAVGSVVVNRARLVLAVFFLALTHLLIQGELLPVHAEPSRWWWLGCSGIIGLALGDSCLFQALVLVGPHLSMLLMSLVPVVSTLVAWAYLNGLRVGQTISRAQHGVFGEPDQWAALCAALEELTRLDAERSPNR